MINNVKLYNYIDKVLPVITEKALQGSEGEGASAVFKAPKDVTKADLKAILEYLYKGVKVLAVNSLVSKGKRKKFRGTLGKRADTKKFYVKLDKSIDITTGIK